MTNLPILPSARLPRLSLLRLQPGEAYGEPVPLHPASGDLFRDATTPAYAQRVVTADPALTELVLDFAREAWTELNGSPGDLVVIFYTAPPTAPVVIGVGGRALEARLSAFATTTHTVPPTIWFELDGRLVSHADLRELVRHEVAHIALAHAGIIGAMSEAAADTFASGGLAALRASLGGGAQQALLTPGVAVEAGSITVSNVGGTVIIDGTSDMFKIVATGTLSVGAQANSSVENSIQLTSLGQFATTPGHHNFISNGNQTTARQHVGFMFAYADHSYFGAGTPGGYVGTRFCGQQVIAMFTTQLTADSYCRVALTLYNAYAAQVDVYGRYYVLKEAAL